MFVSNVRPSAACEDNPLGEELEDSVGVGGTRAQLYDGYIHYGVLTSEKRPTEATLSRGDATSGTGGFGSGSELAANLETFRARIAAREGQLSRTSTALKLRDARH
jgi:hypothetical protein